MKDPSYQLRKSVYELLNNTITINGNVVPAYDIVPNVMPYIRIGETYVVENSDRTTDTVTVALNIYVVTSYEGEYGGMKDSDDISNNILQLINSKTNPTLTGYHTYITELLSASTEVNYDEENTITKILRFRFYIN